MTHSPNQQLRLLGLLEKLVRIKRGYPEAVQEEADRHLGYGSTEFGGQEHRDIVVLFNAGHITSHSFMGINPTNNWSSEGIYAYGITDDGEDYLETHRNLLDGDPPQRQPTRSATAKVFIIHGTDPNDYVREVESVCHQFGLEPIRMMEQPNRGMTLPDKLRDNTTASDFYVAVLTHDETTIDGGQRARPNATAEAVLANQNWPDRLVILREDEVEIPSNLQGLGYIQLEGQWSVKLLQEFRAASLI